MRRSGVRNEIPPPLELVCLHALWGLGEGSVKDVQRVVGDSKPLAYTTVMTLDRLARKGAITRRKVGRAFVYSPQISRTSLQTLALKQFLEGFFDGSEQHLLEFLRNRPVGSRPPEPVVLQARSLDAALL